MLFDYLSTREDTAVTMPLMEEAETREADAFIAWLVGEMRARGIRSQSEFARRGELSQSLVSMVLSGTTKPGMKFMVGAARALELPLEAVLAQTQPQEDQLLPQLADWNRRIVRIEPLQRRLAVLHAMETVLRTLEGN